MYLDTVGFGHKMTQKEHDSGFIDGMRVESFKPLQLMELFRKDQREVMMGLKKGLRRMGVDHTKWTRRKLEAAFDIHYNVRGGINTYPKFVKALDANDWKTAQEQSARFYTDDDGKKQRMQGRMDLWDAQFMGSAAAKGYGTPEADKETASVMDEQRKQRVSAATGQGVEQRRQEQAAMQVKELAALPSELAQGEQIGREGGFLRAAQQQDGVLVDTPAPDIDLGGMMSKEYKLPTGGEKGMLSTLPAQLKA